MDFTSLLNFANSNTKSSKEKDTSYFKSKLAPPKKQPKDRKLSENIKEFLKKKEIEEREEAIRKQKQKEALMASRDTKQKNKINKMLKVIKSANKSVLEDAGDEAGLDGEAQPDEDDYGYSSKEASAMYSKLMQKYQTTTDPPSKSNSRDFNRKGREVSSRAMQEKLERTKQEIGSQNQKAAGSSGRARVQHRSSKETTRTPTAQPEPGTASKPAVKKVFKPAPVISFNDILKMAEKKQHEDIVVPVKQKQETGRLMTKKEKEEEEQRKVFLKRRNERLKADNGPSGGDANKSDTKSQPSKLYEALTTSKTVKEKPAQTPNPKISKPSSALPKPAEKPIAKQAPPPQKRPQPTSRSESMSSRPPQRSSFPDAREKQKRPVEEYDYYDDEEEDYDSDMDSFIDDEPVADVSSYIKEIFGYDKNRYRNESYDDVDAMESSYAQQMKEEVYSKKVGLMEDLEDMKQEELEKKHKAMRKKQKVR